MKLFWTYNDIPEFSNLTEEQRKSAWSIISPRLRKNPKVRMAFGMGMGVMVILFLIGTTSSVHMLVGWNRVLIAACLGGVGGLLNYAIVQWSIQKHMKPYIERYVDQSN